MFIYHSQALGRKNQPEVATGIKLVAQHKNSICMTNSIIIIYRLFVLRPV